MKQVLLSGRGQPEVLDVPAPHLGRGCALVRNVYSLISTGTEGAAITKNTGLLGLAEKATQSADRAGEIWRMVQTKGVAETVSLVRNKLDGYTAIGYSCAGVVIAAANDVELRPGQRVACIGTGFANHAQIVTVPRKLSAELPAAVSFEQGAFGALGCIAIQGLRRLELSPGETVAVLGLGLIGQLALRIATAMGYDAFGFDVSEARVTHAQRYGRARQVYNSAATDPTVATMQLTRGTGADGVLICASSQSDEIVNQAFDLCRRRGRVSVVGDVGLGLQRAKMYAKELELRLSCSYGPGRYDPGYELEGRDYPIAYARWTEGRNLEYFLELLSTGRLNIDDLISARVAVSDAPQAYAKLKSQGPTTFGVLLQHSEEQADLAGPPLAKIDFQPTGRTSSPSPLRVAVIGTGGYASGVHLPNLARLKSAILQATASKSGASATVAARKFGARYATSDYQAIIGDDSIDAVLIATRHSSHAELVLAALEAGKHVYVEKPMALTIADCLRIVAAQRRSGRVLRVGFNRRFSPFCRPLRDHARRGRGLLDIRVNVGNIANHWSNSPSEGGRLLGEAVHFVDLANWMFGEQPKRVSAQFLGAADLLNPDVVLNVAYASGSVASVSYSTLGGTLVGKERIGLSAGGGMLLVDDYKTLSSFGPRVSTGRLPRGDKGQLGALQEFVEAIRTGRDAGGADATAGLLATAIILGALESGKQERAIAIDSLIQADAATGV